MCIIAIKPSGVAMPDKDIITNMWISNPDGAGFMYAYKGRVYIEKGFMKRPQLEQRLNELGKALDMTATPFVLHFRITTHGGTSPENTHPFPILDNVAMLRKLRWTTDIGVAHNGVIPVTPRGAISDTMEYIVSQLSCIKQANRKFYTSKHLMRLIENTAKSKLAFLTEDGKVFTVGEFSEVGGMLYSNTSYMPRISYSKFDTSFWQSSYVRYNTIRALMPLPANRTEVMVKNAAGDLLDNDEFYINSKGCLYRLEWESGCAYKCPHLSVIGKPVFNAAFAENIDSYDSSRALFQSMGYIDSSYDYFKTPGY